MSPTVRARQMVTSGSLENVPADVAGETQVCKEQTCMNRSPCSSSADLNLVKISLDDDDDELSCLEDRSLNVHELANAPETMSGRSSSSKERFDDEQVLPEQVFSPSKQAATERCSRILLEVAREQHIRSLSSGIEQASANHCSRILLEMEREQSSSAAREGANDSELALEDEQLTWVQPRSFSRAAPGQGNGNFVVSTPSRKDNTVSNSKAAEAGGDQHPDKDICPSPARTAETCPSTARTLETCPSSARTGEGIGFFSISTPRSTEEPHAGNDICCQRHLLESAVKDICLSSVDEHAGEDICLSAAHTGETSQSSACALEMSPSSACTAEQHFIGLDESSSSSSAASSSSSSSAPAASSSTSDSSSDSDGSLEGIELDRKAYGAREDPGESLQPAGSNSPLPSAPPSSWPLESIREEESDMDSSSQHTRHSDGMPQDCSALRLQSAERGRQARAVLILQAWARGKQQRASFHQKLAAVLRLQRWFRRHWIAELSQDTAAIPILSYQQTDMPFATASSPRFSKIKKSDVGATNVSKEPQLSAWKPSFAQPPMQSPLHGNVFYKELFCEGNHPPPALSSTTRGPTSWLQSFFCSCETEQSQYSYDPSLITDPCETEQSPDGYDPSLTTVSL